MPPLYQDELNVGRVASGEVFRSALVGLGTGCECNLPVHTGYALGGLPREYS